MSTRTAPPRPAAILAEPTAGDGAALLSFAGFTLDGRRAELRGPDGEPVRLRRKALELLSLLAANPQRVLGKQEIMDAVWPNLHVGEDNLYQCVREVRAALGGEARDLLRAVPGRGYLFDAEVLSGADPNPGPPERSAPPEPRARRVAIPAAAAAALGLAAAALVAFLPVRPPASARVIAVAPFLAAGAEPDARVAAANLTRFLTDGLAAIPHLRVIAAPEAGKAASASTGADELYLSGEIERGEGVWSARARLVRGASGEVLWSASHSVPDLDAEASRQQVRLAAGIGYFLAQRLSALVHAKQRSVGSEVVIDQALASITRTSRENFATAEGMLEKALATRPEDLDLKIALATHLLRGIQIAWYPPGESEAAEHRARDLLARAMATEPDYAPVLQAWCRLLTVTNEFADALVACARALQFNPWDGLVLYHVGLAQLQLGRFDDALATFLQADRIDVPAVSRWTWLLGAGLASLVSGRDAEAVAWLERSLAVTPGTGRTHFALAAALQRLGRKDEAKAAIEAALRLRPGATVRAISLPARNSSPRFSTQREAIEALMVEAGLPAD